VLGARELTVAWPDGTHMPARLLGQDFFTGLALLETGRQSVEALPLRPSTDLQLGQDVFIVAAAEDNSRRVNDGVISSLAAFDAAWEYALERAICTTATNPGLGGAPLLDESGRIIGVVSLDLGQVGRFTLAIPVDEYLTHRDELLQHGRRISRPSPAWIGLYCYTFREHVVIAGLLPGAPGEQAGLKPGDVVIAVDERPVTDRRELYAYLSQRRAGELIQFRVFRDNQVTQVPVPSGNAEEFFA